MIEFQCPKCEAQLRVPDSQEGKRETCPHCGNVAVVLAAPHGEAATAGHNAAGVESIPASKPRMPGVIWIGLFLFITYWMALVLLPLLKIMMMMATARAAATSPAPELQGHDAFLTLTGMLVAPAVLLVALELLGVIMAARGYAWGAVLQLCLFVPAVFLWLFLAPFVGPGKPTFPHVAYLIYFCAWVLRLLCFALPPAWTYYEKCELYRYRRAAAR